MCCHVIQLHAANRPQYAVWSLSNTNQLTCGLPVQSPVQLVHACAMAGAGLQACVQKWL